MEVSEVICKTNYLTDENVTLEVETTAIVDFNDGHPPVRAYCNFDYVPTEWVDDPLITNHEGVPQPLLVKWLKVYRPFPEDWQPVDTSEV